MADYLFTVQFRGTGDTPDEAWIDVIEAVDANGIGDYHSVVEDN